MCVHLFITAFFLHLLDMLTFIYYSTYYYIYQTRLHFYITASYLMSVILTHSHWLTRTVGNSGL